MRIGTRASQAARRPSAARLGAVDVNDVRPFSPYERRELEQATEVTQGAERTADVLELDEAHAGRLHALAKRPAAVRRHGHVEVLGEHGQQARHVGLRAARFGERDEEQDPWTHRETASA